MIKRNSLWLFVVALCGLFTAACVTMSVTTSDTHTTSTGADVGELTSGTGGDADAGELGTGAGGGKLAAVCPSPVVLQTDWYPESEYGTVYNLIGEGYEVNTSDLSVRGPMVLNGESLGIDFEVRAGGPAIGRGQTVQSFMHVEDAIHLGFVSTDDQILQWRSAPVVSVFTVLEKSPQIIMWDPATYPEVETIADLGELGVPVNVFGGNRFPDVLVAQGVLNEGQIEETYDGSPARFVSEQGRIAQQGFVSAEVYKYEHTYEEWGKPVDFQLLHDAGFQVYTQTIAVRPDRLEDSNMRSCLEALVPVFQKSTLSFLENPAHANALIVDVVEQYNKSWEYSVELADFAVDAMREYELLSNGVDSTVGNLDGARVQSVLDAIRATRLVSDVEEELTAEQLYTNDFIDAEIGFQP